MKDSAKSRLSSRAPQKLRALHESLIEKVKEFQLTVDICYFYSGMPGPRPHPRPQHRPRSRSRPVSRSKSGL